MLSWRNCPWHPPVGKGVFSPWPTYFLVIRIHLSHFLPTHLCMTWLTPCFHGNTHWVADEPVTESDKPGSPCLMHSKAKHWQRGVIEEGDCLPQGPRQGEWVANAWGFQLTVGLQVIDFKVKIMGKGCRVCGQLVPNLLIDRWWGDGVISGT